MTDDGRPSHGADWPPPVPAGIHLRPRAAIVPSDTPEPVARAPAPEPQRGPALAEAARVTATVSLPPPPGASRIPVDAPAADGPLLDPAGYRLRLVRDSAAALAFLVGVVLVGSLLARPTPTGDVLSATGAPDAPGAADPRGAPGMLLPDPPAPVAPSEPALSPSPTPGSSATTEPAP
jgi:hypothetical protein